MNAMILHSLFVDNPELAEAVFRFCRDDPDYCAAERDYEKAEQIIHEALGYSKYSAYETQLNAYMAKVCRAYYLFGLGLREEILNGFRTN